MNVILTPNAFVQKGKQPPFEFKFCCFCSTQCWAKEIIFICLWLINAGVVITNDIFAFEYLIGNSNSKLRQVMGKDEKERERRENDFFFSRGYSKRRSPLPYRFSHGPLVLGGFRSSGTNTQSLKERYTKYTLRQGRVDKGEDEDEVKTGQVEREMHWV